jgi:phosphate transport system permease protein
MSLLLDRRGPKNNPPANFGLMQGNFGPPGGDQPGRPQRASQSSAMELLGSAFAAFALIWLTFSIAGISAPFGLVVSAYLTFVTIYGTVCWRNHGVQLMKERMAALLICSGAFVALFSLTVVLFDVLQNGLPVALADFPHFFVADMTHLGANAPVTAVGVGPAIVGTAEQVGLAALFTVPIGILTATYLVDATGLFSRAVASVVDAMTGSPAIIAGLFVYLFWVAPHHHSGKTGLAGALALAVMMLPMVTRASQEVIAVVPGSLREAALALGAPEWRVALQIVLPTAKSGLANAVILAIARVTGETAPILFDVGGNNKYNWNPFSGQQDNLAFRVYDLVFQPDSNAVRDAWGCSLVLILFVFILFLIARILGRSNPGGRRRLRLPVRRSAEL